MARLSSVVIQGFWGAHRVEFSVFPDVTFLIGVNGSGKSTVLNLVGAALSLDGDTLADAPFSEIELTFQDASSRRKPRLLVTKAKADSWPGAAIEFELRMNSSSDPIRYHQMVRRNRFRRITTPGNEEEISERLQSLCKTTWLTVHRSRPYATPPGPDRPVASMMDAKLDEVSDRLVRYFSLLSGRADEYTESFQREVFLLLLQSESPDTLVQSFLRGVETVDEPALRSDVEAILDEFKVAKRKYAMPLGKMFTDYHAAAKDIPSGTINVEGFVAMFQMSRLQGLVKEWKVAEENRQQILEGRDAFLRLLNGMLQRKTIHLTQTNELEVETKSGRRLSPTGLSSGEKQLLIFFGEALLQDREEWLYVVDEPEISLHVEWQAQIVGAVRELNPNAQLFFATHSPDVVADYSERIVDMEQIVK